MKLELHKDVRVKRDENYDNLKNIERSISERIRAEFTAELAALRFENDSFNQEEREFYKGVEDFLRTINSETRLKVSTQTGKGSLVIREYVGHLERDRKYGDGTWFNFVAEDYLDGKPFTIGFSCLQSIEIIKRPD